MNKETINEQINNEKVVLSELELQRVDLEKMIAEQKGIILGLEKARYLIAKKDGA